MAGRCGESFRQEPPAELVARVRERRAEAGSGEPRDLIARLALSSLAESGDGILGALVERWGPVDTAERVFNALCSDNDADHQDGSGDSATTGLVSTARLAFIDHCLDQGVLSGGSGSGDSAASDRRVLAQALDRWQPRARHIDLSRTLGQAACVSAGLLAPGDAAWPSGLSDLGVHAPLLLWFRGRTLEALHAPPGAAIVGSRANTMYGAEVAAELAVAACRAGVPVVSGGAYGIDAVAHRAALGSGGTTVAFLAGGIDQFYPAGNTDLLRNVVANGAVLTETAPGTRPTRWRFLNRNRLIAACSETTVIVEAGARSGAINTAHHAATIGRRIFAVPGPITSSASAGCHRLIADGTAELLQTPQDLHDVFAAGRAGRSSASTVLVGAREDPMLIRVLDALSSRRGIPTSEVARRAGISVSEATDTLALAELQGRVLATPSGWRSA
jgi:DNA processing protein